MSDFRPAIAIIIAATLIAVLAGSPLALAQEDHCGCDDQPDQSFDVIPASEGRAAIKINGLWGFVDAHGKMLIAPRFGAGGLFSEGLAAVEDRESKLDGYIDATGRWAIAPVYNVAYNFRNGVALVRLNKQTIGIDRNGQQVIGAQADVVLEGGFRRGETQSRLRKKQLFQRWNRQGELLTTFRPATEADALSDYAFLLTLWREDTVSGDLLRAWSGPSGWGYVDVNGQWLIPPQFTDAEPFVAGRAVVRQGGLWGIIDRQGNWLAAPAWESIYLKETFYVLKSGGQQFTGWFDEAGVWRQRGGELRRVAPVVFGAANADTGWSFVADLVDTQGQSLLQPAWRAAFADRPLPKKFRASLITEPTASRAVILLTELTNTTEQEMDDADDDEAAIPATEEKDEAVLFFPAEGKLLGGYRFVPSLGKNAHTGLGKAASRGRVPDTMVFRDTGEILNAEAPVIGYYNRYSPERLWSAAGVGFALLVPEGARDDDEYIEFRARYIVVDRTGRRLLPDLFDRPEDGFHGGMAVVCQNEQRCGAIDAQGHLVIPLQHTGIDKFPEGSNYTLAWQGRGVFARGEVVAINKSGQTFDWPKAYRRVNRLAGDLFQVQTETETGVIRGNGEIVLAPAGNLSIHTLDNGLLVTEMYQADGSLRRGLLSGAGVVLHMPVFQRIEDRSSTPFLRVYRDDLEFFAVMDAEGRLLTDFDVKEMSDGSIFWLLETRTQKRVLLPDGTLIPVPADMDKDYAVLEDGSLLMSSGDHYGHALANAQGQPISAWYAQIDHLGGDLWEGQGPLDQREIFGSDGRVRHTLPPGLHALSLLQDGKARSRLLVQGKDYAILDWQDNDRMIALPKSVHGVAKAGENGLISMQVGNNQAVFVDMDGHIVTKVNASDLKGLKNGVAIAAVMRMVKKEEYARPFYGMVNQQGRWIIPARYARITDASDGLIWAQTFTGNIDLLNTQGRVLGSRILKNGRQAWVENPSSAAGKRAPGSR